MGGGGGEKTRSSIYLYIYIFVCVYVCLFICVKGRVKRESGSWEEINTQYLLQREIYDTKLVILSCYPSQSLGSERRVKGKLRNCFIP